MAAPQAGIFALGTAAHAYLEFAALPGRETELATAVASLREPRTTMGGVNLVAGFRPGLWAEVARGELLDGLTGFDEDLVGRGARDALTFYARPLTGAYYFIPSTDAKRRLAGVDEA